MTTNRMRPRAISVPTATETTVLGLGCEGTINGARVAALTVDCTGIAVVHVLRLYRRATSAPTDAYALFSGPTNLTASIANAIDLSDLDGYDIRATLTQTSGAATAPVISWSASR
jgi:hypothetical protein